MEDILKKDGLTFELLKELSYQSSLGIRLKKNLHYFNKQELFDELQNVNEWYDLCNQLQDIACVKNTNAAVLRTRMSLRRRFGMCYLIAKNFNDAGCLALRTEHG